MTGAMIAGGRILLCHRSLEREWYPNVWDLPGGHIDDGETAGEALKRELLEELGISVDSLPTHPLGRIRTPEFEMQIWRVTAWDGTPSNRAYEEHDAIAWFAAEELPRLKLAHSAYLRLLGRALGV